ncbi:hypothetical protein [Flavivirga rizhaonensis]|uniref:Lipoprotein n=1 Tax=Flavivirga rizhaonensis TaxID=2559571 RepID=A0A4S1E2L0_9FLAO|nr:hypothetical protein [Flavivirga rizhaonensis]TGV04162.1 hypothetical protein EM932_03215 [Flavivirga rizhaonensis]
MKTRQIVSTISLTTLFKFFLAISCAVLLACTNDDDASDNKLNLEGTVLGNSGCNGVFNVDVDGFGVVAVIVPAEFNTENTRIKFDMQVDQETIKSLICNANVIPPEIVYKLTNVTSIGGGNQ